MFNEREKMMAGVRFRRVLAYERVLVE